MAKSVPRHYHRALCISAYPEFMLMLANNSVSLFDNLELHQQFAKDKRSDRLSGVQSPRLCIGIAIYISNALLGAEFVQVL